MYYEPYKKRRGAQERERRGGCLPRALWFLVKFLFKLADSPSQQPAVGFDLCFSFASRGGTAAVLP